MSEGTAGLRRKIDSAGDLKSAVRSIKALAAASIGQCERVVVRWPPMTTVSRSA